MRFVWTSAFLLLLVSSYAQKESEKNSIRGKVVDQSSGEALPYATIVIKGTTQGTISNSDGFFSLINLPPEAATLSVQFVGYEILEVAIADIRNQNPAVLKMKITDQFLNEVVITGSNLDNQMISTTDQLSRISLSPKALKSLPSMGEQDIFRALQLLPGVSGTNEASSGLYVRGGTPDQNLVLLDGFTVYHVDHFYGFFSAFNPNAIKDVQLYKGGFEAKYGGRLSSVMELTGKTGNQNKFSWGAGVGAISANAYFEVPFSDKLNLFIAGRRSYTDIIESGVYSDIFDLYNDSGTDNNQPQPQQGPGRGGRGGQGGTQQEATEPSFFFYDFNGKLTFRPSQNDNISWSFYGGADDLDNSRETTNSLNTNNGDTINIYSDINDVLRWGNFGSSIRWSRQWGNRFYSNVVASYSNYFSDRDRLSIVDIDRGDSTITRTRGSVETNDLRDYTLSLNNEYLINDRHTLNFGAQVVYNDIIYDYVLNDTIPLIDQANRGTLWALFLQDAWQLLDGLTVTGGLRTSYYDVTSKTYFEPRLSSSYQLTDKLKVSGAWGHYYQFVNRIVREDVTEGSRDFWLLADDVESPVSFSEQFIAGVTYETPKWLVNIEAFDKSLDGISEFSLRFSSGQGQGVDDQFFFEGTGVARGLEFLVQKKAGQYKGWVSYTLSEVVHDIPGISDEPFYALHDSRHEINWVNTIELGRWVLGATWVYGTGKPYTAPVGEYTITTLDGTDYEFINVGSKNAFRLPDYHRMDLSFTYNFPLGKGEGSMGLSIFNFYDRTNVWYKEFLIEEDEVIETDVTLIGFTPNLNISVKF